MGVAISLAAETTPAGDPLTSGFLEPPRAARPSAYWLWLNGYVNPDYIETELRAYADHGVGGLLIFDMGARGNPEFFPPVGPPFMGDASVEMIAKTTRIAKRLGLDVQLAACSSWDLGGSWVRPEHASMRLYHTKAQVRGPSEFNAQLPFPELPADVPRDADGKAMFSREVALLAIPENDRLPGHEFIFRLPRGDLHRIDHIVLYNAKYKDPKKYGELHLFTKKFSVAVSTGGYRPTEFQEVVTESLAPNTKPQRFDFHTFSQLARGRGLAWNGGWETPWKPWTWASIAPTNGRSSTEPHSCTPEKSTS